MPSGEAHFAGPPSVVSPLGPPAAPTRGLFPARWAVGGPRRLTAAREAPAAALAGIPAALAGRRACG